MDKMSFHKAKTEKFPKKSVFKTIFHAHRKEGKQHLSLVKKSLQKIIHFSQFPKIFCAITFDKGMVSLDLAILAWTVFVIKNNYAYSQKWFSLWDESE